MSLPVQAGMAMCGTKTQVSWCEISGGEKRGQGGHRHWWGAPFYNPFTTSSICKSLQISEWLLAREKNVSPVSEGAVRQESGAGKVQERAGTGEDRCGGLSHQLGIKGMGQMRRWGPARQGGKSGGSIEVQDQGQRQARQKDPCNQNRVPHSCKVPSSSSHLRLPR